MNAEEAYRIADSVYESSGNREDIVYNFAVALVDAHMAGYTKAVEDRKAITNIREGNPNDNQRSKSE